MQSNPGKGGRFIGSREYLEDAMRISREFLRALRLKTTAGGEREPKEPES
jgi:hypothetical protein